VLRWYSVFLSAHSGPGALSRGIGGVSGAAALDELFSASGNQYKGGQAEEVRGQAREDFESDDADENAEEDALAASLLGPRATTLLSGTLGLTFAALEEVLEELAVVLLLLRLLVMLTVMRMSCLGLSRDSRLPLGNGNVEEAVLLRCTKCFSEFFVAAKNYLVTFIINILNKQVVLGLRNELGDCLQERGEGGVLVERNTTDVLAKANFQPSLRH